ncbi:MAG: 50S ribosomal protein L6 [Chloroflexi bacterium]|jgi:large subunit ribosomal protein L6|uniref:Large ribosomal subunit protein uL6 n=1 Tax=Candidatus Thermofonsia Clade 3 bacterium TaxID=2364212 RepID=A0A2M8QD60_9CHLR|nr:50S ribosomal protein L6 [Candidatus Roseilinea sp. NK_OTU-006]PJF47743.1 MAG: 50S ribosomal protein L6 [Candidatus Thermofonsia Clade 3 bacterium]RMG61812.1 MAG: 50S ribosomal protein L6 [Chloroflexota bacterium]
MSRIGKKPIELPKGVDVAIHGSWVTVKGPKGELQHTLPPQIRVAKEGNVLSVQRDGDENNARALHGLTRALLANMVKGVSEGYTKVLEIGAESVGYRAEMSGNKLMLYLGYSHPIEFSPPPGITFATDAKTRTITISGIDKVRVGDVAAQVRKLRPPEPYKGKGIRYQGEVIRRKAGKAGKTGKGK